VGILPLARLHEAYEESAQAWAGLQSLGVFEIATSEEQGGSGLGAVEEALIVIELGRRAIAPSVLATVCAAHLPAAVNRLPPPAERRVALGHRRAGRVVFVEDAAANLLLVRELSGAALFPYPRSARVVDETLWSSRLVEGELGDALARTTPAHSLRLRLLEAAVLAGLARAALDMAVGYATIASSSAGRSAASRR
jgi:alkylation response protein AidB-like acyl-CoA dehydrogenase